MQNLVEYITLAIIFILLLYGLTMHMKQTIFIQRANDKYVPKYKRTLIGYYLTSISFIGFSISFILNVANIMPSNYTVISCFAFLIILFIAKFGIIPKQQHQLTQKAGRRCVMRSVPVIIVLILGILFISACSQNASEGEEYPFGHYEDDKMIGNVWEVEQAENRVIVDISEWEKRDWKGPGITEEAYYYTAEITEDMAIKKEDGSVASIDDFKKGQKVLVHPPRDDSFEGTPEEIMILEMTYQEKYERLLAQGDSYNIVVMYEMDDGVPSEMEEQMYEKAAGILEEKEQHATASWMPYDEDFVVDYQEELSIETFPVILVFDNEELLLKTYQVDEMLDFFENL